MEYLVEPMVLTKSDCPKLDTCYGFCPKLGCAVDICGGTNICAHDDCFRLGCCSEGGRHTKIIAPPVI